MALRGPGVGQHPEVHAATELAAVAGEHQRAAVRLGLDAQEQAFIEQMEADGLIGPADGIKGRPVL